MKKIITIITAAFFALSTNAQTQFQEIPLPVSATSFDGVAYSSIAFADIDGDSDQDVLITGQNSANQRIAKLYKNDGTGSFTEVPGTPFDGVYFSSIAFADIDGDSDQDVLITGYNSSSQPIAKLYTNNGSGTFTEVTGTPFEGVYRSSIAFADIDGDNDQDVLITGENSSYQYIAKLYTNNGSGTFTEVTGTPFEGVAYSSIAYADIDNDSDQDVLITGINSSSQPIAKLYKNNGTGSFTEVTGTPFDGVGFSSIAFADIDGDSDQDVLITGRNSANLPIAKLYTNNGTGTFTEVTGTPFDGVHYYNSIAFADIDGDSDQDVLITGGNNANQRIAKLYTNNGTGTFTEVPGTPFEGVYGSSIAFADIDGDSHQDVLITGRNNANQRIAKLYKNNGTGTFTEIPLPVSAASFDGVYQGSIAFADIDGDSDQDVLITGLNTVGQRIAKLYTNNGTGTFTEVTGTPFDGVDLSSIAFADIDGDNDQDVLITGRNSSYQYIAKLYTNNGSGTFTEVTGTPFEGVYYSSIAYADIDNDSDQDVLITGRNSANQPIAKLYKNDGTGTFTEVTGITFEGVYLSSIAFADIDGDSDQDVLITGRNSANLSIAKLYTNNGTGTFTEVTGTPFEGVQGSSIAFADIDGDLDQDVLITGLNSVTTQTIAKLYKNNGSGTFTEVTGTPFDGVVYSSIAFADIDGDSDQDVLITGGNSSNQRIAKLYTNNGTGTFTEVTGTLFEGVDASSIAFADIDNDSDQDVLITGRNSANQRISVLWRNMSSCSPTTGTDTQTACGSYTWINGVTYTSSNNTATHTIVGGAANGCDSIATLNLTINNATTSSTSITACDSYTWNGNTYTATGTYTWTGTNAAGCDSTATLNLTINNATTSSTSITACDAYTWNGNTYTATGTYTWSGTNAAGCDSTATLNLTINNASTSSTSITACDSYSWNGTTYTATGTYTWTGTNAAGCDSTATLNLTINNASTSSTSITACDSYSWNGNTYTATGTYTWTGTNAAGCDSTATLNLTINNATTSSTSITACDSYSWNGNTYTATGTYTWTGTNVAGCDSTATLNLTIDDVTAPVPNIASLSDITSECSVTSLTAPTATDNCAGTITGTHNATLPITSQGTTVVTWTYNDGNGNTLTQTQNVIITPIDNGITQVDAVTLSADVSGYNYQWLDCNNGNQAISGAISQTFVASTNGSYAVEIDNGTCTVTSNCIMINQVGIFEIKDTDLIEIYPNPTTATIYISSSVQFNQVEVMDAMGKRVEVYPILNAEMYSLTLPEENGVYFVKVYFEDRTIIKRIVKK